MLTLKKHPFKTKQNKIMRKAVLFYISLIYFTSGLVEDIWTFISALQSKDMICYFG